MKLSFFAIKHSLSRCLVSLAVISGSAIHAEADSSIAFNGENIIIDNNTVVLDAENLLSYPNSFSDPAEAFARVNELADSATLIIAPSVYWLDNPDDPAVRTDSDGTPFAVKLKCRHLSIKGISGNPEDVVLAVNRGQTQGAVGNFTMFLFDGSELSTENVTFGNYCNVDLVYPRNPALNRKRRNNAIVQAQIGICKGTDRLSADNCRFISRLNLCPFVGARRSLFKNCTFECTDDALSGSAVYLDCDFKFFSSKPFYSTDRTGAVFLNCDIHSLCDGTQYFTKVPGQVTAIDTRFHGNDNLDIRWTRDPSDVRCFQHNISLNGKPYTIDSSRPELWSSLAGTRLLDAYAIYKGEDTIYNLPNLLAGDDNWNPSGTITMPSTDGKYENLPDNIPVTLAFHADKDTLEAVNDKATVVVEQLRWGGYPMPAHNDTIVFSADNPSPAYKTEVMNYSTGFGLDGRKSFCMRPNLKPAPGFKETPRLRFDKKTKTFSVDYSLQGTGHDSSTIYWTRIAPDGDTCRQVRFKKAMRGHNDTYTTRRADLSHGVTACVVPAFADSHAGYPVFADTVYVDNSDMIHDMTESSLHTDFSDIPVDGMGRNDKGIWNFDIYKPLDTAHVGNWTAREGAGWYYGRGFDASVGVGLVQNARGARLSYIPARDGCRDMSAQLTLEPAKSGGQGFGSATAQYMDICIKFDPIGLNGFALRIERTPDHDRAVMFSLVEYKNGQTTAIHPGTASNCFRTPCHILVSISDGIFTATARTDAPLQKNPAPGIADNVVLSVPVTDNSLCGFCIQHTGSTGPSSTLIKNVTLNWN